MHNVTRVGIVGGWAAAVACMLLTAPVGAVAPDLIGRGPDDLVSAAGAHVRAGHGEIIGTGWSVDVPVEAVNVTGLAAATVVVGYDPTVVEVTACKRSRAFDVCLCNPAFDRDRDGHADAVRFNGVSLDGRSGTESEPLGLVTITFRAVGGPGASSELVVEVPTFTDVSAEPIPVTSEAGSVSVGSGRAPVDQAAPALYLPAVLSATHQTDEHM